VDRSRFAVPGGREGRLDRLDGEQSTVSGDRLELLLGANDVAVWTL